MALEGVRLRTDGDWAMHGLFDALDGPDTTGRRAVDELLDRLAAVDDSSGRAAILDPLAMRAAAGSRGALGALLRAVDQFRLAQPAIRRLIVDGHDAEEVAQDVLIEIARSIGSYRGDSRFTTWLYSVARHTAAGFLRRRKDALSLGDRDVVAPGARLSSMIATRASIRSALDGLAPEYRDAVVLRDVERLAYQEIADRLGLNLNTARSRIARGRAMLANAIVGTADSDELDG